MLISSYTIQNNNLNQIYGIWGIISKLSSNDFSKINPLLIESDFISSLISTINLKKPLLFILPAFPAKSPNPEKTSGALPDFGELISLIKLNETMERLNQIYEPGAKLIICSDGRVFNDLVLVSDDDLIKYQKSIEKIITRFSLRFLDTYNLDNCFESKNFSDVRNLLVQDFGTSVDVIKNEILLNKNTMQMFNGIHRFIKEDRIVLISNKSKTQICEESKTIAYEVIRRSRAWDNLLEKNFSHSLRLSIHPYDIYNRKFSIQLVPGYHRWATPWHNVTCKINGEFRLMKKKEAIMIGAVEKKWEDEYVFYEA